MFSFFGTPARKDGAKVALGRSSTAQQVVNLYGQSLGGKTAVVTGANSGIGYETSRVLAANGCRVVMCCRSKERGEAALKKLQERTNGKVSLILMDLADLVSVEEAAKEILNEERIDFLILNAGIMACPQRYTKQGFEDQIGSNHFGHFHLTSLLMDKIKSDAQNSPNRIVVLSSVAHQYGTIQVNDLHFKNGRRYSPWGAYGQSKLANILFARELADRLKDTPTTVVSVHPGVIATELWREGWVNRMLAFFVTNKNIPQGAATTVYGALAPQLESFSGSYLNDCDIGTTTPEGADETGDIRKALWKATEEQIQEALAR